MNKREVFLCPMAYTLRKRMVSNNKRFGLFCYHIVPITYLFFLCHEFDFFSLLSCFLLILAFYSQYEIGYIYNDAETVKREKEPSNRLDMDEIQYYENNKTRIYLLHFLCFVIVFPFLYILGIRIEFILYSLGVMLIEIMIFFSYNKIREKKSLVIFFCLELFKYLPFVNWIEAENKITLLFVASMIYAIPNTIERLAFKRYGIMFMQKILPSETAYWVFRIVFYMFSCLFFLFNNHLRMYVPLFLFLFLFRCFALLKIKM